MSEQRQYSENPDIEWALDLLKPDPNYEPSILQKYASEIIFMGLTLGCSFAETVVNSRPFYSGIQRHTAFVALAYVASQGFNKINDKYKANRDTRLRNYVILHPELFPKPVRVKYADVFKPWIPVR